LAAAVFLRAIRHQRPTCGVGKRTTPPPRTRSGLDGPGWAGQPCSATRLRAGCLVAHAAVGDVARLVMRQAGLDRACLGAMHKKERVLFSGSLAAWLSIPAEHPPRRTCVKLASRSSWRFLALPNPEISPRRRANHIPRPQPSLSHRAAASPSPRPRRRPSSVGDGASKNKLRWRAGPSLAVWPPRRLAFFALLSPTPPVCCSALARWNGSASPPSPLCWGRACYIIPLPPHLAPTVLPVLHIFVGPLAPTNCSTARSAAHPACPDSLVLSAAPWIP